MRAAQQLVMWALSAVLALGLLFGVLQREHPRNVARFSTVLVGSPSAGARVFREKGCAGCHAAQAVGTGAASRSGPAALLASMWTHAPGMWAALATRPHAYSTLTHQDTADVFAYLHAWRYLDDPGELPRGREAFEASGCGACHRAGESTAVEPALAAAALTPLTWSRAMWNHPRVQAAGAPALAAAEMRDVLTYLRRGNPAPDYEQILAADARRGAEVFARVCMECHPVSGEGGRAALEFSPGRELPATVARLSASLWNHAQRPGTSRAGQATGPLSDPDTADLVAFLYSFRYSEPGGSANVGESLFAQRGCSRCHGAQAEGSPRGPGLRGRGRSFSTVTLASDLWRHGPRMYRTASELGVPWPTLAEGDVGDLLTFLNSPPREAR